jgi:hypothetical protein
MTNTEMTCVLVAAVVQGIGSAVVPLVQAAVAAHKEKMSSF